MKGETSVKVQQKAKGKGGRNEAELGSLHIWTPVAKVLRQHSYVSVHTCIRDPHAWLTSLSSKVNY